MGKLPPAPIETANEIDHLYIDFALNNKNVMVDEETAEAVNESIDRFIEDMDAFCEWLNCPEMQEFIKEL